MLDSGSGWQIGLKPVWVEIQMSSFCLRGILENLSAGYGKDKAELQQLKIQMVYQKDAMKDVEAESAILRKRLREAEEDSHRLEKLLRESLAVRWELKEKMNDLKLSLVLAKVGSPKSDSE